MKHNIALSLIILSSLAAHAQTIIQYGKYQVSKDEFLRAYNKNKVAGNDKEKSIRDYVELYTNFKLKVKAAQELRLDTSYQLQTDYENFRRQIENNYLNDEAAVQKLMNEAVDRGRRDLHLMLYSAAISNTSAAEDTLAAYQAIVQLQKEFGATPSPDIPLQVKQTDLGYLTVFNLPYRFEHMAYALKTGESTPVFRNKKGWHFMRLVGQRPAMGKWRVAQILFSYPPDADFRTKGLIQKRADSVYQLLLKGSDFAAMARTESEDRITATNGGEMPEFGTGKYDPVFENEVAQLERDNQLSAPFSTSFGVHIIKRLGYTPIPESSQDETWQYEIKQKLMQDDRIIPSKDQFAKSIMKKVGYRMVPGLNKDTFLSYADTVMNDMGEDLVNSLPISHKIIIQFTKGQATGKDWLQYVRDVKSSMDGYRGESNEELWDHFQNAATINYYRKNLEKYNSEFAYQIEEFSEGNMMFDIMEKKVWSKAANDSVGLMQYFLAHQNQYKWNESADVLVFNCNSPAVAQESIELLSQGVDWRKLIEMKQDEVQGDSSRFDLSSLNISGPTDLLIGKFSDITVNPEGSASFMQYLQFHPKDKPKTFEQAKGIVINDYQSELEKKWLEELRKKYPVKVNEAVIKSIIK